MWTAVQAVVSQIKHKSFLCGGEFLQQQLRTTFILNRKFPPQLYKKSQTPKTLRSRHYVYDLINESTSEKKANIEVILTEYVEGLGNAGERVFVPTQFAYDRLLLPGMAVYVSPENVQKFEDLHTEKKSYSSPNALFTMRAMSRLLLSVVMNRETPWILKPWHLKASFRKSGFNVPEKAITLPVKPIIGPDIDNEGKEFFVTVTINEREKTNVRCRLHHWSTDIAERIPYEPNFWENSTEPLLPEQAEILQTLPQKDVKSNETKST